MTTVQTPMDEWKKLPGEELSGRSSSSKSVSIEPLRRMIGSRFTDSRDC